MIDLPNRIRTKLTAQHAKTITPKTTENMVIGLESAAAFGQGHLREKTVSPTPGCSC
jgi:ribosomal protein L11 methylase PrmA